ncbi:MAG: phosphate ABC transporter permease subunit PstC [Anaerolineales bacterium]
MREKTLTGSPPVVLKPARLDRRGKDRLARHFFMLLTCLPALLLVVMLVALAQRAAPILQGSSLGELLTGSLWHPYRGQFGFWPFISGTAWVTVAAMLLATPVCLLCALYLSEYARPRTTQAVKPLLDLLAGIPSVVYGVWGVLAIVPLVGRLNPAIKGSLGFLPIFVSNNPTGFSVLAGAIVLAVMVTPFIIAVTYEVLRAVPQELRQASLAVGASHWQTVKHAVLPQALPGIIAGCVLGLSRALGETMAVLMVVGNVAQAPGSIFDPAYPLPALIANNYGEMMSIPRYEAALMGAALLLLVVVLGFNLLSAMALRRLTGRRRALA